MTIPKTSLLIAAVAMYALGFFTGSETQREKRLADRMLIQDYQHQLVNARTEMNELRRKAEEQPR